MSTITLSCLVVGENPYENAFNVKINKTEAVSELKDTIKEKQKPFFDNVAPKDIKLWKVDISLKEENKKRKAKSGVAFVPFASFVLFVFQQSINFVIC